MSRLQIVFSDKEKDIILRTNAAVSRATQYNTSIVPMSQPMSTVMNLLMLSRRRPESAHMFPVVTDQEIAILIFKLDVQSGEDLSAKIFRTFRWVSVPLSVSRSLSNLALSGYGWPLDDNRKVMCTMLYGSAYTGVLVPHDGFRKVMTALSQQVAQIGSRPLQRCNTCNAIKTSHGLCYLCSDQYTETKKGSKVSAAKAPTPAARVQANLDSWTVASQSPFTSFQDDVSDQQASEYAEELAQRVYRRRMSEAMAESRRETTNES